MFVAGGAAPARRVNARREARGHKGRLRGLRLEFVAGEDEGDERAEAGDRYDGEERFGKEGDHSLLLSVVGGSVVSGMLTSGPVSSSSPALFSPSALRNSTRAISRSSASMGNGLISAPSG